MSLLIWLFTHTLRIKNTKYHPVFFSERMGKAKCFILWNYAITIRKQTKLIGEKTNITVGFNYSRDTLTGGKEHEKHWS